MSTRVIYTPVFEDRFDNRTGELGPNWTPEYGGVTYYTDNSLPWQDSFIITTDTIVGYGGAVPSTYTPPFPVLVKQKLPLDPWYPYYSAVARVNATLPNNQYASFRALNGYDNASPFNMYDAINGAFIRAAGDCSAFYWVSYDGSPTLGGLAWGKYDHGTWTVVERTGIEGAVGYGKKLSIDAIGNVITIRVDGQTFEEMGVNPGFSTGSFTDSDFTAGFSGLIMTTSYWFGTTPYAFSDFSTGLASYTAGFILQIPHGVNCNNYDNGGYQAPKWAPGNGLLIGKLQ